MSVMKNGWVWVMMVMFWVMTVKAQSPDRINARRFYSLMQQHPKALLVDVRPAEKYRDYRIKGALPAPEKKDLLQLVNIVPTNDTIFLYCEKDIRTGAAAAILDSLGYQHLYVLKGGLMSWRRNGYPIEH
ncbi:MULTISPECIES: rhodanese-like domain-containing protein [unclassified Carboxylicivirga]|uniref:rhodanese-like domain-containing protein n=1 Tax=Carboxylicivirga TaxID=1628153 RepID=UPI003D350440